MKLKSFFKPADVILFILVLAAGIFALIKTSQTKGSAVIVDVNGVSYEYSLSEDGIYTFDGAIGKTTMEIKDGRIRFTDSDCPNKTCVNQGWSRTIVCLPNKVIATINDDGGLDAIAE